MNSKNLVVFFSRADENYGVGYVEVGNTEVLAGYIKDELNADTFKIVPNKVYPKSYNECTKVAKEEKNNQEVVDYFSDINTSTYSNIFIGYPIWWDDLPRVVYNFLSKHNLNNKVIIPFCTHEGSGKCNTFETIWNMYPSSIKKEGMCMKGSLVRTSREEIISWINSINL